MTPDTSTETPLDNQAARLLFDPILGWRRRPGVSFEELEHLRRRLVIGENGFRVIPGQPQDYSKRVWIFGCSCTEGQWLEDDDTFCVKLQRRFPNWKIEAFGIGGYSNFQNLLQLEASLNTGTPDVVIFTYIPGHGARNVAAPELWFPTFNDKRPKWGMGLGKTLKTFRPAARLNRKGGLKYHRIYPPNSQEAYDAMMAYEPDPFYKILVTTKIILDANNLAASVGADFHFAFLWSNDSARLNGKSGPDHLTYDPLAMRLREQKVNIIDADPQLPFEETTFAPVDGHPNAVANAHFAKAIGDALEASK